MQVLWNFCTLIGLITINSIIWALLSLVPEGISRKDPTTDPAKAILSLLEMAFWYDVQCMALLR